MPPTLVTPPAQHAFLAGEPCRFTVAGSARDGTPYATTGGYDGFTVGISGPARVQSAVSHRPGGVLGVEFTPQVSGQYTVSIAHRGAPLSGSPFALRVAPSPRIPSAAASPRSPARRPPARHASPAGSAPPRRAASACSPVARPLGSPPLPRRADGSRAASWASLVAVVPGIDGRVAEVSAGAPVRLSIRLETAQARPAKITPTVMGAARPMPRGRGR